MAKDGTKSWKHSPVIARRRTTKQFFIILILFLTLLTSGCNRQKPIILFNKDPISIENIFTNSRAFKTGERIYYIVIVPKPLEYPYIRVQLIKKDAKIEHWGYKIAFTVDGRLTKDEIYYYTDYVVVHEPGYYFMQVFSKDKLMEPLARGDFFVRY